LKNDLSKDFKLCITINKRIKVKLFNYPVGLVKLEQSYVVLALRRVHDKAWFLAELTCSSKR